MVWWMLPSMYLDVYNRVVYASLQSPQILNEEHPHQDCGLVHLSICIKRDFSLQYIAVFTGLCSLEMRWPRGTTPMPRREAAFDRLPSILQASEVSFMSCFAGFSIQNRCIRSYLQLLIMIMRLSVAHQDLAHPLPAAWSDGNACCIRISDHE